MYLGSHLDNKSLGEMDVIFWSILKVNVFTVFLKLKVLVLVAREEKVPHFLCYKKSVLIREQDAELAGATDRPIVIQKSEEFPKLFHLFNLSTAVNLMPKPKTEDLLLRFT